MKYCIRGEHWEEESEFHMDKRRGRLYPYCKKCHHKQSLESQHNTKQRMMEYLGGKCKLCNYDKCIQAMHFHHINSEDKSFNISELKNSNFDKAKPELDKCILLCGLCHTDVHSGKYDAAIALLSFKAGIVLPKITLTVSERTDDDPIVADDCVGQDCSRCFRRKPLECFTYIKAKRCYFPYCKKCDMVRARAAEKALKESLIAYGGGCCKICGYNENSAALDFHHLDPTKKDFGIATKRHGKLADFKDELDKCHLLCNRCHAEVHAGIHTDKGHNV